MEKREQRYGPSLGFQASQNGPAPIVYVYLGSALPRYAFHSIKKLSRLPNQLVVLADFRRPRNLPKNLLWLETQSFYDHTLFSSFASRTPLPAEFRDGFWLKTAERFFVLRDFASHFGVERFFHAELDVLLFSLQAIESSIEESGQSGIFMPRETDDRIVASLVFVNSSSALGELCSALDRLAEIGIEMYALGSLNASSAPWLHNLPTAEFLYRVSLPDSPANPWKVTPDAPNFIVDGAALGRWFFGVDPRNRNYRGSKNRIQNQKSSVAFEFPMSTLKFEYHARHNTLFVTSKEGKTFQILALHVHSKIHRRLSRVFLKRITSRLNKGRDTWMVYPEIGLALKTIRRLHKDFRLIRKSVEFRNQYLANTWRRLGRAITGVYK